VSDIARKTLMAMSGQKEVIVVHRALVDFTGSLEAAMMLGQLLYWAPRARIPGGWIAKSDRDWEDELYIGRHRIAGARQRLIEMGILEVEIHRFDGAPTNHYRLKDDELTEQWSKYLKDSNTEAEQGPERNAEISESIARNRRMEMQKSASPLPEIGESLTETTTETTAKTTSKTNNNPRYAWFSALLTRAGVIFGSQLQAEQWMDLLDLTENNRLLEAALEATAKQRKRATPAYIRRIVERCLEQNCMPDQWPGRESARASPQRQSGGAWEQW